MSTDVPKPAYSKSPIIESVIHLSVTGTATSENMQKLVKRFAADYPQQEPLTAININLDTTGGPASMTQQLQGYRVKSADQTDIVLVFPNGVAAARLSPYPGWEHLRERAYTAWTEWRRSITHSTVKRIGIRYINRIDVPIKDTGVLDIDAYLSFTPRVPEFSEQPLNGFIVQVTRPTNVKHWNVSITSTIVSPPPLIDHASMLLDIDVFRTEHIPGREADLWASIDTVRPLKNEIFEACITDEARKLFT